MNLQTERIQALCQQLQLDAVAVEYPALADHTARIEGSHSDFLEAVLKAEHHARQQRKCQTLLRLVGLPAVKTLDDYDFRFVSGAPRAQIQQLAGLAFVERAENVVLLGPIIDGFYNPTRRHQHLSGLSPEQFEAAAKP